MLKGPPSFILHHCCFSPKNQMPVLGPLSIFSSSSFTVGSGWAPQILSSTWRIQFLSFSCRTAPVCGAVDTYPSACVLQYWCDCSSPFLGCGSLGRGIQCISLFMDTLVKAHYRLHWLHCSFQWQSSQYSVDRSGFVLRIGLRKESVLVPMLEMEKLRQKSKMTCSRSRLWRKSGSGNPICQRRN